MDIEVVEVVLREGIIGVVIEVEVEEVVGGGGGEGEGIEVLVVKDGREKWAE